MLSLWSPFCTERKKLPYKQLFSCSARTITATFFLSPQLFSCQCAPSLSVNGNEEPRWRDLSPIQFSCNCNYSLIIHNKTPVHSTWGLLRESAACPTPRLNLSSELRPSGNNIQDTFPTGSAQDATECLLYFANSLVTSEVSLTFTDASHSKLQISHLFSLA